MELRQIGVFLAVMLVLAIIISLGSFSLTGFVLGDETPTGLLPPATEGTPTEPLATQESVNSIRLTVNQLQLEVDGLQATIEKNEQDLGRLSGNIQGLGAQVSNLQQSVDQQIKTFSVGLAGLQENVQSEFSSLKTKSQQRKTFTIILSIILISLAGIITFYFFQKKSGSSFPAGSLSGTDNKIMDYITSHIKQGKKYSHIKQNLQTAGWLEQDIRNAYQDTLKRNFNLYKKKKTSNGSESQNQIKIIGLVGAVVIFTGIIIFFAFGTSTGQAYQKYGGVDDYEEGTGLNRVLSEQQCFPPRIMVSGQCCDDRNQNTVCDVQEGYTEISTNSLTGNIIINAATAQDSTQNHQISITANGFEPAQLTVVAGDSIEFVNNRMESARVIPSEDCPVMDIALISPRGKLAWTPATAGNCEITVGVGASNEPCQDNNQCAGLRSCIDRQCKFIADLYQTASCSEYCTIIRAEVITTNLDPAGNVVAQNYTLRMGLGSYTTGGALDWTIKPVPDFCKPSNAKRIHQQSNTWRANIPIPFEIREFSNSELLGTRVETIVTGEQKEISHRTISLDNFALKIEDVHLTCGDQTVFG
ncbi:MAG TPA: hypothetical protein VJH68_03925 [Candidatus Nanoarchaeia archaeon]|nr:hypothetical protein [Candidatus Nanoarchaeia archaeon]